MREHTYDELKEIVNEHLLDFLPEVDNNSVTLYEAMKYSLNAGGKRLRPVLLLASCEFSGGDIMKALPYACAIEYIHTYSLIHDDLPCMDDDELRRGQPTNHIIYGEAMATLAGDGLQSAASEAMLKDQLLYFDDIDELKKRISASYEIIKGSGCKGMVAGQTADIESENRECSNELLNYIHLTKTAALIVASVKAGALLGGADKKMLNDLTVYAENLGLAFQVADDILDVMGDESEMGKKSGQDKVKNKLTYPEQYGLDKSKEYLVSLTMTAKEALADYYDNAEFFTVLAQKLSKREK